MKTLQEIKDHVAKDMGYHDYKTAWSMFESGAISAYSFQDFQQELLHQVATESLKNASERVCSENCYRYSSERNVFDLVEQSILDERNIPGI